MATDGGGWLSQLLSWARGGLRKRDVVREMEELIEEGTAEGVIHPDEEEMLLSVLEFKSTMVREIMVPRTDMACADAAAGVQAVIERMVEAGHTRIPLYAGEIDKVIGIIHARDILRFSSVSSPPPLSEMMRPALFVPETMRLERLLGEFRLHKHHMAVVVDELRGNRRRWVRGGGKKRIAPVSPAREPGYSPGVGGLGDSGGSSPPR